MAGNCKQVICPICDIPIAQIADDVNIFLVHLNHNPCNTNIILRHGKEEFSTHPDNLTEKDLSMYKKVSENSRQVKFSSENLITKKVDTDCCKKKKKSKPKTKKSPDTPLDVLPSKGGVEGEK